MALERAGISVDNYYASEIDKHAIKISESNYPDIIRLGDVTKVFYKDGVLYSEQGDYETTIDLVLAGSPCTGFSLAGKQLAFNDPQSKLYFEFERILKETNAKYFLLENTRMKLEYKSVITERLKVSPILINSNLLSAQNRPRLYWTNIPNVSTPEDKEILLHDILLPYVEDKYYIKAGRLSWLQKFGEVKEKGGYVAFNPDKAKCLTVRREPSWNTTYILQ